MSSESVEIIKAFLEIPLDQQKKHKFLTCIAPSSMFRMMYLFSQQEATIDKSSNPKTQLETIRTNEFIMDSTISSFLNLCWSMFALGHFIEGIISLLRINQSHQWMAERFFCWTLSCLKIKDLTYHSYGWPGVLEFFRANLLATTC